MKTSISDTQRDTSKLYEIMNSDLNTNIWIFFSGEEISYLCVLNT